MWTSSSGRKSKKKGSSNSGSVDSSAIESMFQQFADEDDPTALSMEGICKLCEQLGLDPLEDIRVLVLLWKLGAEEKPAQISKSEWEEGCQKHQLDSIDSFKKMIPSLDTGFLDRDEFKEFYKFCFQFNRQGTHRTLDKEMVTALMNMVLKGRIGSDRLETFCKFLELQTSYTRITLDQWTSFLDFCYECEDLSTYDESTSAWPVLIDEYVDYMEEQQKKK
mmetsp:Transcript_16914/g.47471  ORF Transcript_16914/g.47471 Transcript_16914/m.47471 type:complete len:221 (+) Transcript_16914:274-936(+)|eukprot:CAMPEP_0119557266 /NCGR_PEP_ID=MMETSP1352-20130426/8990_1 /TAXON_ID=265584 /ORGANISM="Stauroneis constricta, Strain CCMP1120" /LENGTH=220 /DNA_ID=CAMNT_0007604349 /DNA_START=250 /DNA_END=912 /DNA_ORIENTATION=+